MNASSAAAAERLSPQQITSRLDAAPIAYLPLGSLEFHGPHLPIGLDALTAHGICLAAAGRTGGVVLPPYYQAVGGEHTLYPWTIMSRNSDAIETLLSESLARLAELGVHRVILLSGHFAEEQRALIDRVAHRWNAEATTMRVIARTLGQVPESPAAPDHAGRFESLVLHAVSPELVHLEALPSLAAHPAPAGEDPYGQARHRDGHPLHGVFGADPRGLDFADGDVLFDHLVSWVADLALSQ